jgi:hypothetical protein
MEVFLSQPKVLNLHAWLHRAVFAAERILLVWLEELSPLRESLHSQESGQSFLPGVLPEIDHFPI